MAQKKNYRADNTYMISTDHGDNPKLGAKVLSDGRESLFLDYYLGYTKSVNEESGKTTVNAKREREYLKLYLWQAPRTQEERQHNKDVMELAKRVRFERGQEMLERTEGYRIRRRKRVDFLEYYQDYLDNYDKKDKRNVKLALARFRDFLNDKQAYRKYAEGIRPEQMTRDMMLDFVDYLQKRSTGEGAHTIFARFKKVVAYAADHDVFVSNPCKGISIKVDDHQIRKDVLSVDEIRLLAETHYSGENPDIRRAFLFCLYTGLRFCDVKDLTFANIDRPNMLLKFEQNKTRGHSSDSGVVIPLKDDLLRLIGEPCDQNDRNEPVFKLPSHTMCLKALRHWTKRAGIEKHITWHCARHSFAVNILNNGANIKTVASLLGHSGLQHTEKYTRATDSLKRDAINSLPEIKSWEDE